MPARRALALALFALVAAACGERPEPLDVELSPYPVTVRGAGERVELSGRPERIAALDPGAVEIIVAVGAADRLVAVPSGVDVPPPADPDRVVRRSGLVDVGALAAARPDLVIATGEAVARVEGSFELDAPLYAQPNGSVRDVLRAILEIGLLVGEPVRARELVASLRQEIAEVDARVRDLPRRPVFVDIGFFTAADPESLVADLVRRAGGDLVTVGGDGAGVTDVCELAGIRPEVIVRVVPAGGSLGPVPRGVRECSALADTEVVDIPEELIAWPGPGIADGLRELADALHGSARR